MCFTSMSTDSSGVAHAQEQTLFANPLWPAVTDLCLDSGVVQPVLSRSGDNVLSES